MSFRTLQFILVFLLGLTVAQADDWRSVLEPIKPERKVTQQSTGDSYGSQATPSAEEIRHTITEEDIRLTLQDILTRRYNVQGDFRLYLQRKFRDREVNHPNWKIKITDFPVANLKETFNVRFRLYNASGERLGDWRMPVRCELWKDAYIAKRRLNSGEKISERDFTVRTINALRLRQTVVPASTSLNDYELNESVRASQPLYWNSIATRPVVREDQIVEVRAQKGALTIVMKGRALEDGGKGDYISIRNLKSKQDLTAEVINENQVRIHF